MSTTQYCGCPQCDVIFKLPAELANELADGNRNQSTETVRCEVCHAIFDIDVNLMQKIDDGFVETGLNSPLYEAHVDTEAVFRCLHRNHSNGDSRFTEYADSAHGSGQSAENERKEIRIEEENQFANHPPYLINKELPPTDMGGAESLYSSASPSDNPRQKTSSIVIRYEAAQYVTNLSYPLMTFIWFMIAISFVFLLCVQVNYFFVQQYAHDATYRQYLTGFCYIVGCKIAPRQAPFLFTLIHTKIDIHPTHPDALVVAVKMVNQADFAQHYPHLQLTLTDRMGRVVSRRTFSPDLYLPKGADNVTGQGQVVSIILNLARPHEAAVGFIVNIVSVPTVTAG